MTAPSTASGSEFKNAIAAQLAGSGATFRRDVYLHGIEAEFLCAPSSGRRLLFAVKDWEPTQDNIARAAAQAKLMKELAGVEEPYVILPKLRASPGVPGVLAMSDVINVLGKIEIPPESDDRAAFAFTPGDPLLVPEQSVFAAMPFAGEYDDVYFVAMAFAAYQAAAVVRRTDKESFEGDVVTQVHELIRKSVAVIADISECKPNVMYEVGYAHALDRPTVLICSTQLEDLPFDIRNWNVLPYMKGRTFELREKLSKRLIAAIDQGG